MAPAPWSRLFPVLQAAAFLQWVQELSVSSESWESVVCRSGVILKVRCAYERSLEGSFYRVLDCYHEMELVTSFLNLGGSCQAP